MVGRIQCRQHLRSVQPRGLGQRARDDLEGLGVLLDGVLRQAGGALAERGEALHKLHLGGAGAGHKLRIAGDGLDDIDAVIDSALDVVEVVLRRAADHQRRCAGGVLFLPEDGDAVTANFEGLDDVDGAHFVGHGGAEAGEGCAAHDTAEAAELEFGEDFEDEDGIPVEVVQGELADGGAGNEDAEAGVVEFFHEAFELRFFTFGEVEHFFGIMEQDGAFGFGLRDVYGAGEDANFGFTGLFYGAVGLAAEDHAADDFALRKGAAHDFDDADIVDVEVGGVFGQDSKDRFCNEGGEEVFVAALFGGDNRADGFAEFGLGSYVFDFVDN